MNETTLSRSPPEFGPALQVLADAGVLTLDNRFRDGHTEVSFGAESLDVTGSSVTRRPPSEQDRMRLLGHLLTAAAVRGLQPAELLAIGMAAVLQSGKSA
jgi:hypothetical protein